jgi:hypothetical protein
MENSIVTEWRCVEIGIHHSAAPDVTGPAMEASSERSGKTEKMKKEHSLMKYVGKRLSMTQNVYNSQ